MARPSKSIASSTGKISKEEKKTRLDTENKLKGSDDNIVPLKHLNKRQREIFNYIVENLENAKILGNLDVYILNQTAISIERLEMLEKQANKDINFLFDGKYKSVHDMYVKDFFRGCNELCLSPQARAKLSISAVPKKDEKKTIASLLTDEEDDEDD